jgi:hypothetical protein
VDHTDGDSSVEGHDRVVLQLQERVVEADHPAPVGRLGVFGLVVDGGRWQPGAGTAQPFPAPGQR